MTDSEAGKAPLALLDEVEEDELYVPEEPTEDDDDEVGEGDDAIVEVIQVPKSPSKAGSPQGVRSGLA